MLLRTKAEPPQPGHSFQFCFLIVTHRRYSCNVYDVANHTLPQGFYVATGRERHHLGGNRPPKPQQDTPACCHAGQTADHGRAGGLRPAQSITEPVHGLIKQARGFRQFLLRGMEKVAGEFTLVAMTHNILKLCKHR